MEIKCKNDIRQVADQMHDSEFGENDFGFDPIRKLFYLDSCALEVPGKKFHLEFYNVEECNPLNLDKIKQGKAMGGVFNDITIKKNGRKLIILSQDLKIVLKLSALQGRFELIQKEMKG